MAAIRRGTVASGQAAERRGVRGRPRDAARDTAILDAALALLLELGYDQLSIEAVAARAGVGKTTIYRRFRDKAALIAAVVERCGTEDPPDTSADGLREALLRTVRWLARGIAGQQLGLLAATFSAMRQSPDLAAEIRRILRRDEVAMTAAPFAAGAAHGEELVPHAAALFAEVAPAVIVHRLTLLGQDCDEVFLAHLVDDILLPLVRQG